MGRFFFVYRCHWYRSIFGNGYFARGWRPSGSVARIRRRWHNMFRYDGTSLSLYAHICAVIFDALLQISLGEMVAYLPIPGGHIKLAERFVDPALSFTMGWNYWYNWTIILPAELSAAAVLINFWNHTGRPHAHHLS